MTDTIFVTGGAGFIGSNFVRLALAMTSSQVVVIDKLTYAGHIASLEGLSRNPRFKFVQADITDQPTILNLFKEYSPMSLVNFAAETHVDRSIDGPQAFFDSNTKGTFKLLEVTRLYVKREPGMNAKFRFLQVSTDEVYGSLGASGFFTETTPYAPNSPYSASKASGDHFVRAYFETFKLPTLITHCSNNYGPYQYPEKLIPLTVLNALEGKPLPIYGDGGNVRDWLYVEDHCAAVLSVLEKGKPGETYNMGGHSELTNLQMVNKICDSLEKLNPSNKNPFLMNKGIKSYAELMTFVEDRPGHDRRYAIDSNKIERELGWKPTFDIDTGLTKTMEWYLGHKEWCRIVQSGKVDRQRLGIL